MLGPLWGSNGINRFETAEVNLLIVNNQVCSTAFNEVTGFSKRCGLTNLLPVLSHLSELSTCSCWYSSNCVLFLSLSIRY